MPRFYLHLYNGRGFVEDNHGAEHDDVDGARVAAIALLRGVLARNLESGTIDLAAFVEIEAHDHRPTATIGFVDAVKVSVHPKPELVPEEDDEPS